MKLSKTWKTKRRSWQIIGGLLLVLSLAITHFYKDKLLNLVIDHPATLQLTPPPCNLNRGDCLLPIMTPVASEGPWSFSITPQPIPVSTPLTFTLTPPQKILPLHAPSAAWVEITGDSMDMGLIQIPLEPQRNGQWIGKGSIPICVTGSMRWRARLHLDLAQTTLQADWIFSAPESNQQHH